MWKTLLLPITLPLLLVALAVLHWRGWLHYRLWANTDLGRD